MLNCFIKIRQYIASKIFFAILLSKDLITLSKIFEISFLYDEYERV